MDHISLAVCLLAPLLEPIDSRAELLLSRLGADDYTERERAHLALSALGYPAAPSLRRGVESVDPEVRARCRRLVDEMVARELKSYGRYPFLDSLWMLESGSYAGLNDNTLEGSLCRKYWDYLSRFPNPGCDFFLGYRHATAAMVEDWVRDGVPRIVIQRTLARMRANDQKFIKRMGYTEPPEPIPLPVEVP